MREGHYSLTRHGFIKSFAQTERKRMLTYCKGTYQLNNPF